jgi:hypothetical protein
MRFPREISGTQQVTNRAPGESMECDHGGITSPLYNRLPR